MVSCTDVPQQLGKSGPLNSKEMHKPVPISNFCHIKPVISVYDKLLPDDIPEDMQRDCANLLLTGKLFYFIT